MVPSATLVVRRPRDEVAIWVSGLVPFPRTRPYAKVDAPVPPFAILRSFARLSDPKDAAAAKRLVLDAVVLKRLVLVAFAKVLFPVHVLLLARSVEEAAVIVIDPPLVKVVPFIRAMKASSCSGVVSKRKA